MPRQIPIHSPHKGRPKQTGLRWPLPPSGVRPTFLCPFCDQHFARSGQRLHEASCKRRHGITEGS